MSEPPDRSRAENMEQLSGLARGQRGEQGAQGEQGEQGELSRPVRRALVYLFAVAAGLALAALLAVYTGQQHDNAVQRQQGRELERQLCATFGKAAALKPPAGNPKKNPSRAYLQGEHLVWIGVLADLGCR